MELVSLIVGVVCGAIAGGIGGFVVRGVKSSRVEQEVKEERLKVELLRQEAEKEALEIKRAADLEATKDTEERREKLERDLARRRTEVDRTESRLKKREEQLDRRDEAMLRREENIGQKEQKVEDTLKSTEAEFKEVENRRLELIRRCEQAAGYSTEEAKKVLVAEIEKDARQDAAALLRQLELETKQMADKKARQIITLAIQKTATDHVSETTVSVIQLPSDEMKGRIIGREGRNIRALEQATGVNIIVDDTPEAIVLSCFDPMRREIARQVIEKLLADGRIHPSRIEEIVEKTEKAVLESAREAGEAACVELRIFDVHPELVKLMGRLKYRTSYGQNILQHSIECARIAEVLASELGLDAALAKRATFLHDIGKAVSYEMEGPHAAIGAALAKKHRERPEVVHAIEAHHFEVEPKTLTAMLVITADSISASRPGARRESYDSYIKRIEQLETICKSVEGVDKAFAVPTGREVRVIVQPDKLTDDQCALLARDLAKKIETDVQYPGQIRITVLRETRNTEYAK